MNEYEIITIDGTGNPLRRTAKAEDIAMKNGYLTGSVKGKIVWMFDRLISVIQLDNLGE